MLIEGLSAEELLGLPEEELNDLVLTDGPVTFRAGSADVLGQFRIEGLRLVVELAHIDGGGEGVLPTINSVAKQLARQRGLKELEWVVHATTCARPNTKLLRVLERRGFEIRDIQGKGRCYHRLEAVSKGRRTTPLHRSAGYAGRPQPKMECVGGTTLWLGILSRRRKRKSGRTSCGRSQRTAKGAEPAG